jgi:hypothetical protein
MTLPPVLIEIILAGVVIEAAVLYLWLRRRAPALVPAVLLFLGSGALLLLAVRLAMDGESGTTVAGALLLAGILHVLCLRNLVRNFGQAHARRGKT